MYFIQFHLMEHGVTWIMTLYFLKSVKNWAIYCDFPIGSWTRHFSILSDVEIFTFDPPLKSHQSIWSLIQAYYLIISIPNSKNWKYNNNWRYSFLFMAGQKCHIGIIPFSNRRQNGRAAHFESRYFFFFYNLSTHLIQLFWLRFNCCLTLIFFRPARKVESMKITAWKPFLGQKTQMKKMAKNGKIDLCSANHRICNIRYILIKFSGYIAYDMQFNFLYCFINPFIYEYLIFTFISDEFLRNSQNMGKMAKTLLLGEHVRRKLLEISAWNLVIIGIKIRASKIKGSGVDVSLWRKWN